MMLLFYMICYLLSPLGWSFCQFIWQGMLVAALYSACCLLCAADARRRHALACFFLGAACVLPMWRICLIPVRHHGLTLAKGPPASLLCLIRWTALIWICIAGARSIHALSEAVMLRRQWLGDAAEDMGLTESAQQVSKQIGLNRPPRVLRSPTADVLAVLGWWRPVVVIPGEMPLDLTHAQLRAILAHELAHVMRRDSLINLVLSALEPVVMFHPAAAWLSRELRKAREHCCDDIAVATCGDAIGYARGLTALAKLGAHDRRAVLCATGGDLMARVVRLVTRQSFAWRIWSDGGRFVFWLGCAVVLMRVCAVVCRMM
jgi:beta-lactamase regulating signal transducer with metallopeptidase domain